MTKTIQEVSTTMKSLRSQHVVTERDRHFEAQLLRQFEVEDGRMTHEPVLYTGGTERDGSPYLVERTIENAKGATVRLFSMKEILAFRREHISLMEIAEAETFSPKVMKMKLDGRGLVPVAPKYELGRIWYRREDLMTG